MDRGRACQSLQRQRFYQGPLSGRDVLGSATSAKGERKAHLRSLWTMPWRWR